MIYIDTNIIISFMDELDPNHDKSIKLLKSLQEDKVVSKLTLLELTSVYSRADLEHPLALSLYSIKRVGAKLIDIDLNKITVQALRLAPILKLRSLDLLHVTACKLLGAKYFMTFDKDLISKADLLRRIGITVITYHEKT